MLDLGVFNWLCVPNANPCLREWEKALEWGLDLSVYEVKSRLLHALENGAQI